VTISIDRIRQMARQSMPLIVRTLGEARSQGLRSVFLCHSHLDAHLVQGVIALLANNGWRVYVDWADPLMPETPNRQTAAGIKLRIIELDYFLFLATSNSMSSRWCPWEIGYADGKKDIDRIIVLPTRDGSRTHGSEYLQLYRRMDFSAENDLAVWLPGDTANGVLVARL